MLRSALGPLLLLTLSASLSLGCEQQPNTPTPEKASAKTSEEPSTAVGIAEAPVTPTPAETAAKPAETAAPAEPEADKPTAKPNEKPAAQVEAKPAKPEEKPVVEDTKGKEATSDTYAAWLQGGSKFSVGKPGSVTAVLAARGGYKCNDKYPYKFTLDAPPSGVTYPSNVVTGMNITEKRSTMSIPFTATEKGAKTISGTLAFSVCDADKCLIEKQKLSVTVNVM